MDTIRITGYFRRPAQIVGINKGFFAREGIELDYHTVHLAPQHNRELAEGVWNLTLSSADTMLARTTQDHVDFLLVMQVEEGMDVQLVAQPEIKSVEDLRGKLFAADPVDSNFDMVRNKIMVDHGIPESEYRYEVIGNTPIRLQAFLEKRVAAAMLTSPHTEKALAAGGHIVAEGADHITDWPHTCCWGLRRWIESHRDVVVRFIRGWTAAADWMTAPENREEAIAMVMASEKLSRPRAEKLFGHVVPKAGIDPAAIRKNVETRIELGYYKPPHKPAEAFYDMSYWAEATGLPVPPPAGLPRNGVPG